MLTSARLLMLLCAAAVLTACGEDRAPPEAGPVPGAAVSKTFGVRAGGMVKKLGIT